MTLLDDPPSASSSDEVLEESSSEAEEETPAKTQPAEKNGERCNKTSAKRRLIDGEEALRRSKRKKTTSKDPKVLSYKVWSEGDEIAILKGMLEFTASNGSGDTAALHDLVKKSSFQLEKDFTTQQLKDKIRSLKRKYDRCLAICSFNPTDPHEINIFQLSKQIWGAGPETPEPKLSTPAGDDWAFLGQVLEGSSLPESMLTHGLALISGDQKADLVAQCKQIILSQFELTDKKNQLTSKLNRLIFEALKPDK